MVEAGPHKRPYTIGSKKQNRSIVTKHKCPWDDDMSNYKLLHTLQVKLRCSFRMGAVIMMRREYFAVFRRGDGDLRMATRAMKMAMTLK